MQSLLQTKLCASEYVTLNNIHHVAERELIRDIPGLLLHANRTDPLFGNNNPQILSFLHSPVSCPLTHPEILGQLTNRDFGPYLKPFYMLKQLLMLGN
ncbi:hypothetical protein D3C81_1737280 [compost metagenome]